MVKLSVPPPVTVKAAFDEARAVFVVAFVGPPLMMPDSVNVVPEPTTLIVLPTALPVSAEGNGSTDGRRPADVLQSAAATDVPKTIVLAALPKLPVAANATFRLRRRCRL